MAALRRRTPGAKRPGGARPTEWHLWLWPWVAAAIFIAWLLGDAAQRPAPVIDLEIVPMEQGK